MSSIETTESSIATSIFAPLPVRSRWIRAARIPHEANIPVETSAKDSPTAVAPLSGCPVTLMSPDIAWTTRSKAGWSARGLSLPKPEMLA